MIVGVETTPCPKCDRELPVTAVKCRCGWLAAKADPARVECEYTLGCPDNAILKEKTVTGWIKICEKHSMQLAQQKADAACQKLGLKTPAEQRAWVLANLKNKPLRERIIQREPGEDWGEEDAT